MSAASFYVKHLPGLSPTSTLALYAGNLPGATTSNPPSPEDSDASLYFLLAVNRHIPKRQRLVIWVSSAVLAPKVAKELTFVPCLALHSLTVDQGMRSASASRTRRVELIIDAWAAVLRSMGPW